MIIFLSKEEAESREWITWCRENGQQTKCHSFIQFEAVPFSLPEAIAVVFFTSPRSVRFFLEACPENDAIYACIGKGTAQALRTFGKQASFIGANPANPEEVATQFRSWLGERSVFFPISDQSLKTISCAIPAAQKQEVIVYRTGEKKRAIEACDWYVFTSPSNVRAFLKTNTLPTSSRVVAWGNSTERFLKDQGITVTKTLEDSSLTALIQFFSANLGK
jgi:uroporphyrinogen-III synthase